MTMKMKERNTKTTRAPYAAGADEQARFRELARRLLYCTDAVEEQRLKAELVRSVLRRRERGACVTLG
jgi:hypothetical protein